jgi:O-antigen biosynthesis protein
MADPSYVKHEEFCRAAIVQQQGSRMIDLGGQFSCPDGFESVDLQGADIIADLTQRYPFEDNSIGIVRAYDFMEHIADKMHTLSEIHRILAPGGYLLSMTPSTVGPDGLAGMGSDQDPTHVSRWNRNSFWYVTDLKLMRYVLNTQIKFAPMVLENCYPARWHIENRIPYVVADLKKEVVD